MKTIKWVMMLSIALVLIIAPLRVSAVGSELATEPLTNEEIRDITDKRAFVKLTSYSPAAVKCFDVRDDHTIVMGVDAGSTAIIAVYDGSGSFQYGFETTEYGSFRVMWIENDIAYYSVRGSKLFRINEDGKIIDICRIANTAENSIYDREVLQSATRTVGASTYRMTNGNKFVDSLSGSYGKIIKTDEEGTSIIYDASSSWRARTIGGLVVFVLLLSFIAICSIVGIKSIATRCRLTRGTGTVCVNPDKKLQ